jgi:hypothetical protein
MTPFDHWNPETRWCNVIFSLIKFCPSLNCEYCVGFRIYGLGIYITWSMNRVTTVSDTSRGHMLRTQLHQWPFPMGKETLKVTLAFVCHPGCNDNWMLSCPPECYCARGHCGVWMGREGSIVCWTHSRTTVPTRDLHTGPPYPHVCMRPGKHPKLGSFFGGFCWEEFLVLFVSGYKNKKQISSCLIIYYILRGRMSHCMC